MTAVGVIGVGYIGARHVEAWRRLGVEPRVCGRRDRLESLLDAVDVVDICSPTDTHDRIALAAAAAGRHVICEKPLARTLTAATEMIDACRAAGVGLYPAHVVRFHPAYAQAKDIGTEPVALRLHRASAVPDWAEWLHLPERSGGIVCDFMIHDFDAARWIAGEVLEVSAITVGAGEPAPGGGTPVEARAVLRHAGGATSHVSGSWLAPPARFHTTFEVATGTAILRHDSDDTDAPSRTDPMTAQLAEFLAAIEDATTPRVSAEDGRAALAIALAAIQSAEIGVPVAPIRSGAGGR